MIRAGIIGAGFIADYHVSVLRQLGVAEVVGAFDADAERLDALCARWAIRYRARSLEELLRDGKPDIVHVLVPPPYHFDLARRCLSSGAHVFLEKPMALSTTDCDLLLELAQAKGLRLGVNHNALHHPLYRRLLRDIGECKLGPVQHVMSVNNLPLAQLAAGEHDHWMFRSPTNLLFEQGPHPLSQICDLLGRVQHALSVKSGEKLLRGGRVFSRTWQLSLTCERGTAQVFMSFGRSFPEAWLHVIGQDAAVQIDLLNNVYVVDRRTKYIDPVDVFLRRLDHSRQVAWCGVSSLACYALFLLRLRGRSDPFYASMAGSIEAFYTSMRDGHRGERSAQIGRQVIEGLTMAAGTMEHNASPPGRPSRPQRVVREREGEILVLGGTGFIGRRLVLALAAAGYSVRLLVRRPEALPQAVEDCQPTVCVGDVRKADEVAQAVRGCRAVIHLVTGEPPSSPEFQRLFVDGTRHVAEACLKWGVTQLQFASSIAVYYLGTPGVTITEATPQDPCPDRRTAYTRAKIACERLLMELQHSHGLPVTIFRPGLVVGVGGVPQHSGIGYWPCETRCITWGRGNAGLPFVLVDDVASAMVAALEMTCLDGESFNLVGDVRFSASEYIDALRACAQRDVRLHPQSLSRWMVADIAKWAVKAVAGKPENSFPSFRDLAARTLVSEFDCTKAKQTLGWKPVSDRDTFIDLAIRLPLTEERA